MRLNGFGCFYGTYMYAWFGTEFDAQTWIEAQPDKTAWTIKPTEILVAV